jgi:hypothetical protein
MVMEASMPAMQISRIMGLLEDIHSLLEHPRASQPFSVSESRPGLFSTVPSVVIQV